MYLQTGKFEIDLGGRSRILLGAEAGAALTVKGRSHCGGNGN